MLVNAKGETEDIEVINSTLTEDADREIDWAGTRLVEALKRRDAIGTWERMKAAILEAIGLPERKPSANRKEADMADEKQLTELSAKIDGLPANIAKAITDGIGTAVGTAVANAVKPLVDAQNTVIANQKAKDDAEIADLVGKLVKANLLDEETATLSWGSWRAALPLTNLLTERLSRVARSIDAAIESTRFRVTLPQAETFKALILGATNVTTNVKWRIRSYTDGTFETVDYESGWLEPFVGLADDLEWGDPNWWLQLLPFDDEERRVNLIHIFDEEPTARVHWSFEIDDTTNPAGVIDIGRLFMPRAWEPSINYEYSDNNLSFQDNTLRSTTLGGSEDEWRRINPRVFRFSINYLPDLEAFRRAYPLMRVAGFNGEVFVIPNKEDAEFMQQRSFLGTFSQMDGISQVSFQLAGTAFEIKESI